MTRTLTPYQRKIRHPRGVSFGTGQAPDYNFPKINFCIRGHAIIGDNIRIARETINCRTCSLECAKNSSPC